MDKWNPFPKKEFLLELYLAEQDLTDEILVFWNKIRISPETWTCEDVIHENFWVVAKHYLFWNKNLKNV